MHALRELHVPHLKRSDAHHGHHADESTLRHAEVNTETARCAYDGSPVIQAERLLSQEEEVRSRRAIERRDEPGILWPLLSVNAGTLLCAAAYSFFQSPNNLAIGGASGLSIVLASVLPGLSSTGALWIVNAVLVIVGLLFINRKALFWSVVASILLSLYASILSRAFPVNGSLTGDLWLDLCCTVILVAAGNAIAYNAGVTTGGTEIVVMALAHHTSLPVDHAVTATNGVTVMAGIVLHGPRTGLYCVLGLLIQAVVVNGVLKDFKCHKICTVICRQPARVEEFVVRELSRTATVSHGYGAYSGRRVAQVMTVLTRPEALRLQRFVRSLDENAFMTFVSTSEITGRGFRRV